MSTISTPKPCTLIYYLSKLCVLAGQNEIFASFVLSWLNSSELPTVDFGGKNALACCRRAFSCRRRRHQRTQTLAVPIKLDIFGQL